MPCPPGHQSPDWLGAPATTWTRHGNRQYTEARFFGAALADLVGLWGAVAAYTKVASRLDRVAGYLMAPYLAWVTFAGVLNGAIVRRNPSLA